MNKYEELTQYLFNNFSTSVYYNESDEDLIEACNFNVASWKMKEKKFNKYIGYMETTTFENEAVEIYFSFDVSGYDYWKKIENELHYGSLCVKVKDFDKIDKQELIKKLEEMIKEIPVISNKDLCHYIDYEERERRNEN